MLRVQKGSKLRVQCASRVCLPEFPDIQAGLGVTKLQGYRGTDFLVFRIAAVMACPSKAYFITPFSKKSNLNSG